MPCPTGVHWTFVSVLSSVYQTEPQIKFFTPFELENDAEEDPQKSCKPPSFFLLFSFTPDVIVHWLTDCCIILICCGNFHTMQCIYHKLQLLSSSELYPLTIYLPDQIKMQIVVCTNGHTDSALCIQSPHTRPSFLH